MCGRFTQKFTWSELIELYRLTQSPQNLRPSYNVCPTDPVSVIIPGKSGLFLMPMRWQLIPRWWKKSLKDLPATFNARAESVAEKPMFRDAFRRNRCLIPASGYFEWHTSGKEKQPYYMTPRNATVLTIAGLWEEWRDRVNNETITSCTMIITAANSFISTRRVKRFLWG
jgi:putative SOS response-associated peptidase YedK